MSRNGNGNVAVTVLAHKRRRRSVIIHRLCLCFGVTPVKLYVLGEGAEERS